MRTLPGEGDRLDEGVRPMSPAVKFWLATVAGVVIFVIGLLCWLGTQKASTMHWVWAGFSESGWLLYVAAAWFGRCPACSKPLWRYDLLGDIDPQCPVCGRNRYEAHVEGDRW